VNVLYNMLMKRLLSLALILSLCVCVLAQGNTKHLKMRVAVAPLDWTDHEWIGDWQVPIDFRNAIYEKLEKKLLDTGRFVVLEREAMQALLTEKGIKEETSGQSQKGKITPAQSLVKGKVSDFDLSSKGGGAGISVGGLSLGGHVSEAKVGINVRIFDVDTSELLASETCAKSVQSHSFHISGGLGNAFGSFGAFEHSPLGEATTKAIDEAVNKIMIVLDKQSWSAKVADWDSSAKEATLNAGDDAGVRVGDTFDVYRVVKVIKDPETGEILGKKTARVGAVRVTSVDKKFCLASAVEGSTFQSGDIVRDRI